MVRKLMMFTVDHTPVNGGTLNGKSAHGGPECLDWRHCFERSMRQHSVVTDSDAHASEVPASNKHDDVEPSHHSILGGDKDGCNETS